MGKFVLFACLASLSLVIFETTNAASNSTAMPVSIPTNMTTGPVTNSSQPSIPASTTTRNNSSMWTTSPTDTSSNDTTKRPTNTQSVPTHAITTIKNMVPGVQNPNPSLATTPTHTTTTITTTIRHQTSETAPTNQTSKTVQHMAPMTKGPHGGTSALLGSGTIFLGPLISILIQTL